MKYVDEAEARIAFLSGKCAGLEARIAELEQSVNGNSDYAWKMERERDALRAEVERLQPVRVYARHRDWCDFSRHAGYEYGDDTEALVREHPCDCGFAAVAAAVDAYRAGEKP